VFRNLLKKVLTGITVPQEFICTELNDFVQPRLPKAATRCRELQWVDHFDSGIHCVHLYEVMGQGAVCESPSTLAHIHQYYAQWRIDHGVETQMLLR
jgi:hypothetical protein